MWLVGSYFHSVNGFLFSGYWDHYDNHHWGAAARIRYALAGEVSELACDPSAWDPAIITWDPAIYESFRINERGPLPEGATPYEEVA